MGEREGIFASAPLVEVSGTDLTAVNPAGGPTAPPPTTQTLALDDAGLLGAPSSGATRITVADYFPQPPPGKMRVSEFKNGYGTVAIVQHYYYSPENDRYYLVDYKYDGVTHGLVYNDTWVYRKDSSGQILEDMDSFEGVFTTQLEAPLNHGGILRTSSTVQTVAYISEFVRSTGSWIRNTQNTYTIWPLDVKSELVLGGMRIRNVAVQEEKQDAHCVAGQCAGTQNNVNLYRYYFAPTQVPGEPALGIVAMQWLNTKDGTPTGPESGFVQLTKTCYIDFGTSINLGCP